MFIIYLLLFIILQVLITVGWEMWPRAAPGLLLPRQGQGPLLHLSAISQVELSQLLRKLKRNTAFPLQPRGTNALFSLLKVYQTQPFQLAFLEMRCVQAEERDISYVSPQAEHVASTH